MNEIMQNRKEKQERNILIYNDKHSKNGEIKNENTYKDIKTFLYM